MSYINTQTNQYPISEADIRSAYPNTSFPIPFVAPSEYSVVFPSPYPTYEPVTQYIREIAPVLSAKRQYEQQWEVVAIYTDPAEEAAAITAHTALTVQNIQARIVTSVQERLDNFAKTRNYDSILSAATYATSAIPKFQVEGQYAVNARDNTWATLYSLMGEVMTGTRPMPTGFDDVESELPVLEWPA